VALAGLEPERLEELSAELGGAPWFECDVTDWDAVDAAVEGTVERLGGIDVVVANAGINSYAPVDVIERERFEQIVDVNLLGAWRIARSALPHVVERGGYLLFVASMYAILRGATVPAYVTAKAGTEAFADAIRVELRSLGVDVGVAYYSFLDTDLVRSAQQDPAYLRLREALPAPFRRNAPLGPAVEATIRGIERRSRTVFFPPWLRALAPLRGVLQPVLESRMAATAGEPLRMFRERGGRRPVH
jgi:NAD(P)-dependent dehydrogenase (short-subunit alcohol dehydrogenase family)